MDVVQLHVSSCFNLIPPQWLLLVYLLSFKKETAVLFWALGWQYMRTLCTGQWYAYNMLSTFHCCCLLAHSDIGERGCTRSVRFKYRFLGWDFVFCSSCGHCCSSVCCWSWEINFGKLDSFPVCTDFRPYRLLYILKHDLHESTSEEIRQTEAEAQAASDTTQLSVGYPSWQHTPRQSSVSVLHQYWRVSVDMCDNRG